MAMDLPLLKYLIDIKGVDVTGYDVTELKNNNILVLYVVPEQTNVCPFCGRICPGDDYATKTPKLWRHVTWNTTKVFFSYRPKRITCPEHNVVTEAVPWARHDSCFTKAFEQLQREYSRLASVPIDSEMI